MCSSLCGSKVPATNSQQCLQLRIPAKQESSVNNGVPVPPAQQAPRLAPPTHLAFRPLKVLYRVSSFHS